MKQAEQAPRGAKKEPVWVLIADDEVAIAEALEEFVTGLGYQAVVAANGKQALELARQRWPMLVLTDMMMPYLNGAELIAALRAESAARPGRHQAIILLTAVDGPAARKAGADIVIRKPFELDHLEQVIRQLVDGLSA